ncbi:MAG: DNA-binding protein [Candidatus Dormibacteraeota bacterium]|nr:DNA-binding protein [Candidatus Dormibacteraeota bacterium]MBO0744767.1 DNA-binding protein [Candidatus Dormibacteraeota bacterium]
MTEPPSDEGLPRIGAPATRALKAAGYTTLGSLAGVSRTELLRLHGMGPKALRILESEMERRGLALN